MEGEEEEVAEEVVEIMVEVVPKNEWGGRGEAENKEGGKGFA